MNEGAPMMYHGSGAFGGPGQMFMMNGQERTVRPYPLDGLPSLAGSPAGHATPRRWQPRRERHPNAKAAGDNTAFGYDSDDSSLSSNASGSNKSGEKGEESSRNTERTSNGHYTGGYGQVREWRGRRGRDARPQRRIAPERYLNGAYPFQVKFTPDDLLNGSKWDTLSQEIWDKFIKSQQTEETFRKKMNLWRYLFITIKTIFPRYGLYVVGSTMSGFGLDSSDMDLCLYVRPVDELDPRAHALLHLNYILSYIRSFDPNAELIQAKVPILKFRDSRNGLQVDLNCNNVVGIRNTNLLHCYSRLDWRVRPLVALTKLWAQAHDINDARHRTLSSYSLTLMVIHFLQYCAIRLRNLRVGRVHSGHVPRTHGCRVLVPPPGPRRAVLIELHKLNVPCSTGFIRFAPNTPTLCGKLDQIPIPNRRFLYTASYRNPAIELHGRPTFAAIYRLVDHCHDVLLTGRNGSFEVGPTVKLSCSYEIHLPYGNRVALRLQMGTGPMNAKENDVSNIIHEDIQALCRGMELSLEDGDSKWRHCSQPGDPLRSVQIVSERNSVRLNISINAKKNTSAMWLKVWWMDKAVEDVMGHCDYGWVLSGDFCISAVREAKKAWRQAEAECVRLGGHLASVLNERQQQIMDQLLIHAPGAGVDDVYWIGATDAVHEGEFRWSDGLPFSYAHWFPGWRKHSSQPNDDGTSGQDCVEARREFPPRPPPGTATFMWNDRGCREHNYFVCEKPSVEDPYEASKILCNETIVLSRSHPHAIVSSPGFPRPYPDDVECVSEIRAPPAHTLRLHFEELLTEHEPQYFTKMPFKIIETIERGRRLIVSVPSLWESDGNLYWPKKNVISLKKNEKSAPQSDWKCLPCILKRDNILNYKTAEEEIALMSDFTDTDEKENESPRKKFLTEYNFNNLATKCIQKTAITEESSPMLADVVTSSAMLAKWTPSLVVAEEAASVMVTRESPSMVVTDDTVAVTMATNSSSLITAEDTSSVSVTDNSQPTEADSSLIMMAESNPPVAQDLDGIIIQDLSQDNMLQASENLLHLSNSDLRLLAQPADTQVTITEPVSQQTGLIIDFLSTIQENQKILFDNQQKILKGLALVDTKLEEFLVRSQGPFQQVQQENLSSFKIISNIEELIDFEKQLTDSSIETKYFDSLSIICSQKKTGYNNAYALVDAMFDRTFMTHCSWGGGTKGEPKHCFKAFSKTINLFLKVVHQYDKTFTIPICEDFFKNVLRHSTKRNSAKRVRISTMKNKKKISQAVVNQLPENRPVPPNENR